MSVVTTRKYRFLLVMLLCCASSNANEMFLKAESFEQAPNSTQTAYLFNGTIDKSKYSIDIERISSINIVTNDARATLPEDHWRNEDDVSSFQYESRDSGTYVVGLSTNPRMIELTSDQFSAYLAQQGLVDHLAEFEAQPTDSLIRERYSKYSKAVMQVGEGRSETYRTKLGHSLEIIPDANPYQLRFGSDMSFHVLIDGEPAANQIVRAGSEGFHGHDASGNHLKFHVLRTDENGRAAFLISQKGVWYISLIHMERTDDPDVDYESNWATLTFEVN